MEVAAPKPCLPFIPAASKRVFWCLPRKKPYACCHPKTLFAIHPFSEPKGILAFSHNKVQWISPHRGELTHHHRILIV